MRVPRSARSPFVIALAVFTIVTATVVVVHGLRRYRARNAASAHSRELKFQATDAFLMNVAAGSDAIAAFAILWQLIPIFMAPVCR